MSKGKILVLGIIGSLIGFLGAFFVIIFGGLGMAFEAEGFSAISRSGVVATLTSITGLIGAIIVYSKPRLSGWVMIGSAVVGFVSTFMGYLVGGIFLFLAGVMALRLSDSKQKN